MWASSNEDGKTGSVAKVRTKHCKSELTRYHRHVPRQALGHGCDTSGPHRESLIKCH
ncbi:hypothetical protein GEV33_002840 [Tenebrio molitor]|uniref:Uncharacterized protein n=1 Tax=Tenebrio molitor TaxID=7067 RepID=A0A8J6LP26_TENMO|nr:hypothetical protein GEV33_002840 [Tenebrio molitor]